MSTRPSFVYWLSIATHIRLHLSPSPSFFLLFRFLLVHRSSLLPSPFAIHLFLTYLYLGSWNPQRLSSFGAARRPRRYWFPFITSPFPPLLLLLSPLFPPSIFSSTHLSLFLLSPLISLSPCGHSFSRTGTRRKCWAREFLHWLGHFLFLFSVYFPPLSFIFAFFVLPLPLPVSFILRHRPEASPPSSLKAPSMTTRSRPSRRRADRLVCRNWWRLLTKGSTRVFPSFFPFSSSSLFPDCSCDSIPFSSHFPFPLLLFSPHPLPILFFLLVLSPTVTSSFPRRR